MGFRKKSKGKKDSKSIPGSLGAQIRKYRELRDYSRKELGNRCGFPAPSAEIRLTDYEANKKVPSDKSLQDLTQALGLDKDTLHGTSATSFNRMCHDMFVIEELYGIHPEFINGGYCLVYDPQHDGSAYASNIYSFLQDWYMMYEQCKPNFALTSEENEARIRKYEEWKGIYPSLFDDESRLTMEDLFCFAIDENERDRNYAKRFSENRFEKFNEDLKEIILEFRTTWKPIKMVSDFVLILLKCMEKGLKVYKGSLQQYFSGDLGSFDLFSIKVNDILLSDENKRLYAEIYCGVYTINKAKVPIKCRITALNKEIYLTYSCSQDQMDFFGDIIIYWDRMCSVAEMQNDRSISKEEILKAKNEFLTLIKDKILDRELIFI